MDIYEYLSSRSIIISDEKFKDNAEVSVSDQIQLISDAHKRLLDGKEAIIPRIQSVIGREFEGYKVDIKKNKNYIKKIKRRKKGYGINNIIDEFVNKSALDQGSIKYLRILSIYPNESMKILNKCRNGRIDITNEDVVSKFRNAKECDGIKLL